MMAETKIYDGASKMKTNFFHFYLPIFIFLLNSDTFYFVYILTS